MIKLELHPSDRQLRQFGWIALVGFPLVGLVLSWTADTPATLVWVLAGVGLVTCGLSRIEPQWARPVFVLLMLVALPIGFVVSWVLMALVYFGLFTPVGLLFRLVGRDKLNKRPDPGVPSYWHDRGPARPAASYFRLY